jgi:hypothetical protein
MHPTTSYHLAQARIADLRQHAQRDTLARTARRSRPDQRGHAVSSGNTAQQATPRRP